jgi:hypothetical protein
MDVPFDELLVESLPDPSESYWESLDEPESWYFLGTLRLTAAGLLL